MVLTSRLLPPSFGAGAGVLGKDAKLDCSNARSACRAKAVKRRKKWWAL
jgi:hypothetical protein